jgi:cytochrome c oxidase cbb3-type subunit 2
VPLALGLALFSLDVAASQPARRDGSAAAPRAPSAAAESARAAAARGRRVYVAEGCIGCHSQRVRPGARDELAWGPSHGDRADGVPRLIGVRRQGPDLANAGNRRSAVWHRLHLEDPRRLAPRSTMPSYAHLFGDGRGDDLVAYLSSLGAGSERARYALTQAAPVPARPAAPAALAVRRGGRLFAELCSPCHGRHGGGDGPLAPALGRRPAIDLRKPRWWLVSWGPGSEPEGEALARVVRFGVPTTSMPGHEWLSDEQVAEVVAFVQALRRGEVDGEVAASAPARGRPAVDHTALRGEGG